MTPRLWNRFRTLFDRSPRSARAGRPRRPFLGLLSFEDRIVPAYNLAVDGDVSTNPAKVSTTDDGDVRTFAAIAPGAVLDVADIRSALEGGKNVVITSNTGGGEAGNITWQWDTGNDNLTAAPSGPRSLTLRTAADSTAGNVTVDGVRLDLAKMVNLEIDTTLPATDGTISLTGVLIGDPSSPTGQNFRDLVLNAGAGTLNLGLVASGVGTTNLTTAALIVTQSVSGIVALAGVTVNGPVSMGGTFLGLAGAAVTLNSPVDGVDGLLEINATAGTINAPIGGASPLAELRFRGGQVKFGANEIKASNVFVERGLFSGTGTVTGNVLLRKDSYLAPGGEGGTGGDQLQINGSLSFADGSGLVLDVNNTTTDRVSVSGNVSINAQATLYAEPEGGKNYLKSSATALSATGTVTGAFKTSFIDQRITAVTKSEAPGSVTVGPPASAANNIFAGTDADGTAFKVRLVGPGALFVVDGYVVTEGTTAASKLLITTSTPAPKNILQLNGIEVRGDLNSLVAPKTDVAGFGLKVTGAIRSILLNVIGGDVVLESDAAGPTTTLTSIKAFATKGIRAKGTLSAVTVTRDFAGDLVADAVGKVRVGSLQGVWSVTSGVASVKAAEVNFSLTAKYLGSLAVAGGARANLVLTGADAKGFGLRSVKVKGTVIYSTFDVRAGNVGAVIVGKFEQSSLFVGYDASVPFGDTTAAGQFPGAFSLGSFRTTSLEPFAFFASHIAADTIGTIKFSGVATNFPPGFPGEFGVKYRTAARSIVVLDADAPASDLPRRTNLVPAPNGTKTVNKFHLFDVS